MNKLSHNQKRWFLPLFVASFLLVGLGFTYSHHVSANYNFPEAPTDTTMEGYGIPTDPLRITNCSQLMELDNNYVNETATYIVANNIDCSGVANFTPNTAFGGSIDGRGHTISNITVSDSSNALTGSLFKSFSGKLLNLNITNVQLSYLTNSSGYIGGIMGGISAYANDATISNVRLSGNLRMMCSAWDGGVGGLIGGGTHVTVSNSYVEGSIELVDTDSNFGCGSYLIRAGGFSAMQLIET